MSLKLTVPEVEVLYENRWEKILHGSCECGSLPRSDHSSYKFCFLDKAGRETLDHLLLSGNLFLLAGSGVLHVVRRQPAGLSGAVFHGGIFEKENIAYFDSVSVLEPCGRAVSVGFLAFR